MRKANLRMNELNKFEIIKQVVNGSIPKERAAVKLRCTLRTIYNLKKIYLLQGEDGFVHGNRGRKPITTISTELKDEIILLYTNKYYDANWKHFAELLQKQNIFVSYFALYNILTEAGFISPKCERITRRKKNKELKQKLENKERLTEVEKDYVATTNLDCDHFGHPRKPRAKYFGELLQMDASEHRWFKDIKSFLHLAIDDATGAILGAYFDRQETLFAYYKVFYQILSTHGIPAEFLTDRRTIFDYKKLKNPSEEKDTFTQFGYACNQLGVELTTSSIPQVKGRIERMFGTLQSRLITEMRLAGISNIQTANEFLPKFIEDFNKRFAVQNDYIKSVFDKQITSEQINYILSIISKRIVDNGNCIKYKNKYYQFYDEDKLILIKTKTSCYVLETFNSELVACVNEQYYNLVELERHHQYSKVFDLDYIKVPKYKGHKPKPFHPWSYESFKAKMNRVGREVAH